jgi:hypothetical protein
MISGSGLLSGALAGVLAILRPAPPVAGSFLLEAADAATPAAAPPGGQSAPASSPPPGAPPAPPAVRRRRADVAELLVTASRGEPPLAELRAAATELVLAQPERARSLLARARLAGWLPELRVRVDRRFGRDESLNYGRAPLDAPVAPVDLGTRDDVRYELRATWDLSRMVFNPDELNAQAEALRMSDTRREVETLVVRLIFERRRLKTEAATSDSPDITPHLRRELRIQELEAELDALTGGAFSRLSLQSRANAFSP